MPDDEDEFPEPCEWCGCGLCKCGFIEDDGRDR